MTDDEIIDQALTLAIGYHTDRALRNPFGPWAEDSREFVSAARGLQRRRAAESKDRA